MATSKNVKINNQQLGKTFEQEWMEHLASLGMWVHFMHPAPDGSQPFDVMAIDNTYGNSEMYAYDCKTLNGNSNRFPLSRVEDNQAMAFKALNEHGVYNTYFVIKSGDTIYLLNSKEVICRKENGEKSILLGDKYVYMRIK